MRMNCLIIDDEPVARKGISEYVAEIDFLHLVGECDNPMKASSILSSQLVDLIFLDIQMPKLSGIEFLRTLKNPPLVIFTTAYSEYALEGYSLDIVDYLMKPVTFDRFLKAAQKAFEIFSLKKSATQPKGDQDYFFVKSESKFEKLLFREVCYVEGMQNYAVIHTPERKLITYITMTSLENQLPKEQFLKVHKSYIVAIQHIKAIEGNEILIGSVRIPISRNLKDEVVGQILGNKLFKR